MGSFGGCRTSFLCSGVEDCDNKHSGVEGRALELVHGGESPVALGCRR